MTDDFTGKVAAVTGSSGIGLGAALQLARAGARVYLAGIDAGLNREAADLAAGEGLAISLHQVDVADEASVRSWAEAIAAETDVLHALVNAAGLQTYGTVEDKPGRLGPLPGGQYAVLLSDITSAVPALESGRCGGGCACGLGPGA